MIVMLHVSIAIASLVLTTLAYVLPSSLKLRLAYGLVAATLASGFYLVWSEPAHMLQSCMTGIVYIGVVSLGILAARRRLGLVKKQHTTAL
jgi:hypothetical protein